MEFSVPSLVRMIIVPTVVTPFFGEFVMILFVMVIVLLIRVTIFAMVIMPVFAFESGLRVNERTVCCI